jgi:hypothetical protein
LAPKGVGLLSYVAIEVGGCPILLKDGAIAFGYGVFVKGIVDVSIPID